MELTRSPDADEAADPLLIESGLFVTMGTLHVDPYNQFTQPQQDCATAWPDMRGLATHCQTPPRLTIMGAHQEEGFDDHATASSPTPAADTSPAPATDAATPCQDTGHDLPAAQPPTTTEPAVVECTLEAFINSVQIPVRTPLAPLPPKWQLPHPQAQAQETLEDVASPHPQAQAQETLEGVAEEEAAPKLPKRSERLANHKLSNVPAAKRGEFIMMKRFGTVDDNAIVPLVDKDAYNKVYRGL